MHFDHAEAQQIAQRGEFVQRHYKVRRGMSLRYLRYFFLRPSLRRKYRRWQARNPNAPWVSPAIVAILDHFLTKNDRVLEYGSGRSSLWLAERVGHIDALEHHQAWYQEIKGTMEEKGIDNLDLHHIPLGAPLAIPQQEFDKLIEPVKSELRIDAHAYLHHVTTYPDEHFNLVIVDGRARVHTAWLSMAKLKPGGLLVLDDADRSHYVEVHQWLANWPKVFATIGYKDTVLWQKPYT